MVTLTIEPNMIMRKEYIPAVTGDMIKEQTVTHEEQSIVIEWATKYFDMSDFDKMNDGNTVVDFQIVLNIFVAGLRTGRTGKVTII
jgi:hypothetical protein